MALGRAAEPAQEVVHDYHPKDWSKDRALWKPRLDVGELGEVTAQLHRLFPIREPVHNHRSYRPVE